MPPHAVEGEKRRLRALCGKARTVPLPSQNNALCDRLAQHLWMHGRQHRHDKGRALVVGAVWPLPGEVDLRPLCRRLAGYGRLFNVALAETTPAGTALRFRRWQPGSAMVQGRYGTCHPKGIVQRPDVLLVPLVAWDEHGGRLGYGGGYYDRTLAGLFPPGQPVQALGFALESQKVPHVPMGPHDVSLPFIATEMALHATAAAF
ncbi:5-formyltetrahydrofolate cyclo-ligase [Formicincola oecophyllae]|uniref:5-formyltetrahydrofolate cyclo-ligase n=1 Tax=Formicincola oecophyllae TaxID=2558361 RepID=UPI00143D8850|nr:5-formyltetrahydrofolate cyclo-ligase [Formicincola oecophyllae]